MGFSKWIGASIGWSFGGPIGAIIGMAVGSLLDASSKGGVARTQNQRGYYSSFAFSKSRNSTLLKGVFKRWSYICFNDVRIYFV